ncbi:MAG: CHRD domain-containing protein [Nocardioides sp.]|nr:CHRD domain-containing protein [Nocardioides sp.]
MKNYKRAALAVPALSLAALVAVAAPASAADGSASGDLKPNPTVAPFVEGASGSGKLEVKGTTLSFTLAATGLLAGSPHAAHIHFGADARNECPTEADNNAAALPGETNEAKHFTTTEGAPAYGPIVVSLTNAGDTSPDSGLAVDRFGVGDKISYSRADVEVSQEVADAVVAGKAVVVVHGVDYDGDGKYSAGERGASELDPALPGEATDPALCGVMSASQMSGTPSGGVDTGAGSTSGYENVGLIGAGGLALLGGATLMIRRRQTAQV